LSTKLGVNQAASDGISLNPDGFDLLKPAWILGFVFFPSYIFYWALCTQPKIWIPNSQNRSMSATPAGWNDGRLWRPDLTAYGLPREAFGFSIPHAIRVQTSMFNSIEGSLRPSAYMGFAHTQQPRLISF
jgi:hypothetical protein